MTESITYSEYRKIIREEARQALRTLLEADPVVDTLNANLDSDVITVRDVKKGKPMKAMIVKAVDTVTKPPLSVNPNDGTKKLNSGWTKVKGGLTVTNPDTDIAKYQKEAQELQSKANEGKGEGDQKYKFVVTTDPTAT